MEDFRSVWADLFLVSKIRETFLKELLALMFSE